MKKNNKLLQKSLRLALFNIVILFSLLIVLRLSNRVQAEVVFPGSSWGTITPVEANMDNSKLQQAISYAGGSGMIIRYGRVVKTWGSSTTLYDLKSTTKSIGGAVLGLAIADGRLSLEDFAVQRHPTFANPPSSNASTGWVNNIQLKHLATHTAGFDKSGGYTNLLFQYGTKWHYSDGGLNWLAEITTLAFGQDLRTVLFDRLLTPIGVKSSDLSWRSNQFRDDTINGIKNREFASGISANTNALARIGYLYLREGNWNGQQLLPSSYITSIRVPQSEVVGLPEHQPNISFNASDHYGLLWWTNADGTIPNVPRDAYWTWGLYDSFIIVIPSLDIVAVRAGTSSQRLQPDWVPNYSVVQPFIEPIATSVLNTQPTPTPSPTPVSTPSPTSAPGAGTIIDVYAKASGSPIMELQINDQTVHSFNVTGSTYTKYSYTASYNVSVGQLKVVFVNDGGSNDLFVDRIVVNGVTYQSEAPTTFSTGVYANNKCQSSGGFFQKEKLSCNGYFRYADQPIASSSPTPTPSVQPTTTPAPTPTPLSTPIPTVTPSPVPTAIPTPTPGVGTVIEIYAAPAGTPIMELRINDQVVATYSVSGGNATLRNFVKYSYTYPGIIQTNQIKVAFTNDSGSNDIFIDRIVVNDITYQSEAPTTYSTGVYSGGKCQYQGGYFQKEKLGCNGYFQYSQ